MKLPEKTMCLLLGSVGVGKTLLLKRLNTCTNRGSFNELDEPPSTIPTVGTNLMNILTSRKQEVTVRELGGIMAPIWHSYYDESVAIMFVVDMSNRTQISAACIQFLDMITNIKISSASILLILNKIDMSNAMQMTEFKSIMRLDEVISNATQKVSVIEVSARDGRGLQDVAKWIQEHGKPNQS